MAVVYVDHIITASDSLAKTLTGKSSHDFRDGLKCKILISGGGITAFAGMDKDRISRFSAAELADKNPFLTIRARADRFADDARPQLLSILQRIYVGVGRQKFQEIFGPIKRPMLSALFAGIENGKVAYQTIDFHRVEDVNGRPTDMHTSFHGCPGDSCPDKDGFKVVYLGESKAADRELKRLQSINDPILRDDKSIARHLVEIEASDQPSLVRKPIAIVGTDSSGNHWIDPGDCGAGNHNSPKSNPPKKRKS